MAKAPSLTDVTSGYASADIVNNNNNSIEESFENTLSLDGSSPNAMNADLDLNSNDVLNANVINAAKFKVNGTEITASSYVPSWEGEWATATSYVINDTVREDGTVYICLSDHTSGTFSTDLGNSLWEVFAQKGSAGAGSGDLLAANNLSDLSNAATARANLGVTIGSAVQAYATKLVNIEALTWAANKIPLFSGPSTITTMDFLDEDDMSSDSATAVPSQQSTKAYVDSHAIVQTVYSEVTATSSGATQFPNGDTIPQNTEGFEVVTAAITPTNASNKLLIEAEVWHSASGASQAGIAVFQDTTANALASGLDYHPQNGVIQKFDVSFEMTAGTTSETTFKVRVGPLTSTTLYINGNGTGRKFGGTLKTYLKVTEIKA